MSNSIATGVAYKDPEFQSLSVTEMVGFYGTDPVAQPATIAANSTTASSSTTNAYGYTTAAQADAIVTSLNSVIAALKTLGIIASA
jgi:hypothetical protein